MKNEVEIVHGNLEGYMSVLSHNTVRTLTEEIRQRGHDGQVETAQDLADKIEAMQGPDSEFAKTTVRWIRDQYIPALRSSQ